MTGFSLWLLHTEGASAYVVGRFSTLEEAAAAWPAWTGTGSGFCFAGPAATEMEYQEFAVLMPEMEEALDVLAQIRSVHAKSLRSRPGTRSAEEVSRESADLVQVMTEADRLLVRAGKL